jgi:uncharacterized C2H2 Zn-finger protein
MKDLANNRAIGIKSKGKATTEPEKRFIQCPNCIRRFFGAKRSLDFENHFAKVHGAPDKRGGADL